jgi:hypothetical protein
MTLHCIGFLIAFQCTSAEPAPSAATFCDVASPIRWHATDTRGTKEQADRHNRKWKVLCGVKK